MYYIHKDTGYKMPFKLLASNLDNASFKITIPKTTYSYDTYSYDKGIKTQSFIEYKEYEFNSLNILKGDNNFIFVNDHEDEGYQEYCIRLVAKGIHYYISYGCISENLFHDVISFGDKDVWKAFNLTDKYKYIDSLKSYLKGL